MSQKGQTVGFTKPHIFIVYVEYILGGSRADLQADKSGNQFEDLESMVIYPRVRHTV